MNFINLSNFEKLAEKTLTPAIFVGFICLVAGLSIGLLYSPEDYQQGETVRIMYVHVPSAWMGMFIYSLMAGFSFSYLVWKNPLSFLMAKSAAHIGATFTFICLATGSIWGYPTWGTWWVWDARLTSMLLLFFLYLGYIGLSGAFSEEEKEAKSSSILALVGAINLPIIKYSVEWWNTLHQPASVFKIGGPAIDSAMLWPLGLMTLAWLSIFYSVWIFRVRSAIYSKKLK